MATTEERTPAPPLEEVLQEYAPRVYSLARRMLGNEADAEDVTQEVLLQVVRKLPSFRGEAAFPTWLHRIAYTKFVDSRRRAQRAQVMRRDCTNPKAALANPLDSLQRSDEDDLLNKALDTLQDSHRTVLVLHYLQGLS